MTTETLRYPLVLGPGDGPIEDVTFEVDVEGFDRKGAGKGLQHPALIMWLDNSDVRMRNVRIIGARDAITGFDPAWKHGDNPADWSHIIDGVRCGASKAGVRSIEIDGLHVDGVPAAGLKIIGSRGGYVRNASLYRCLDGIHTSPYGQTIQMAFEDCRVADMWRWPDPATAPEWKSRRYPGATYGGNAFGFHNLRMCSVTRCGTDGEIKGSIKLVNPWGVSVTDSVFNSMNVQGSYGVNLDIGGAQHELVSQNIWVQRCIFDLTAYQSPALNYKTWQGFRLQRNVKNATLLDNLFCTMPGFGTAAIWLDISACYHVKTQLYARGNTIWGYPKALVAEGTCKANADFESVNTIVPL